MSSRRRHSWDGSRAIGFARSIFGLITVGALALATILGGQRYFYCRPMDRLMTHTRCACAETGTDAPGSTAVNVLSDCFEVRVLNRLVPSTLGSDLAVPPAALAAMLPIDERAMPLSSAVLLGADHPIRAGPFSPTALRARLMVFLT